MVKVPKGESFLPNYSTKELTELYHKEEYPKAKVRVLAVLLRKEGKTFSEISFVLKYLLTTVRDWLIRLQSEGISRKCNIKQPGRPKRLTDKQIENLKPILSKSPQEQGFPFIIWTTKLVMQLIEMLYSVSYKPDQIRRILHRLGLIVLVLLSIAPMDIAAAGNLNPPQPTIKIADADSSTAYLLTNGPYAEEHITLPTKVRTNLGLRNPDPAGEINQQIRVGFDRNQDGKLADNETFAIYTVVKDYNILPAVNYTEIPIRMGQKARNRIGANIGDTVLLDTKVVTSGGCDEKKVGLYECLVDPTPNSNRLVAIAPHGGSIENGTNEQVDAMRKFLDKPFTGYKLLGKNQGNGQGSRDRFHITSTEMDNTALGVIPYSHVSYPVLRQNLSSRNFRYAVSFHGFAYPSTTGCKDPVVIYVGGLDEQNKPGLVKQIQKAIGDNPAYFSDCKKVEIPNGGEYAGKDPGNLVNWLTANDNSGIQLEQSKAARDLYGTQIAKAVAEFYKPLISN